MRQKKAFWADRIAIITALVGVGLMVLTILWRINPVEGSVVPRFLTDNPAGLAVCWILFVTCMPVWILVVLVIELLSDSIEVQYRVACVAMLVIQGVVYFMIGKLISLSLRKIRRRKEQCH